MEKDTSVNLGKITAFFMSIKKEILPCYVHFLLLKIVSSSDQYTLTYCGDLIVTAFERTVKKVSILDPTNGNSVQNIILDFPIYRNKTLADCN